MKLILCGGDLGEQNYYANKKLNEITDHSKPFFYLKNGESKELIFEENTNTKKL